VVIEDPYQLVGELSQRAGVYAGVVLVAPSLFPCELRVIETVRGHWPGLALMLAEAEQYPGMVETARRLASVKPVVLVAPTVEAVPVVAPVVRGVEAQKLDDVEVVEDEVELPEQLLTADELRALLEDEVGDVGGRV
jgi:hypothetical protein